MIELNCCGIYKITNNINGKYYIGSSHEVKHRIQKHFELLKRKCHHSIHFQNAYNKYGKDVFSVEILAECKRDELFIYEQQYFDEIIDWQCTYNMSKIAAGSNYDLNNHPNEKEISKKISLGNTDKHTKPFYINGIRYEKLINAAVVFNVDIKTISNRIKDWKTKNYYYENKPKIGEYDKIINNIYTNKLFKEKHKHVYRCECGVEISKDSKFCVGCRKTRKDNRKYINPVTINNVKYDSAKEASKILNIEYATLIYRINTNTITYKDYFYTNNPKNIYELITINEIKIKASTTKIDNNSSNNKKSFIIDGIQYLTLGDASIKLNLRKQLIWDRLRSKKFKNYIYV